MDLSSKRIREFPLVGLAAPKPVSEQLVDGTTGRVVEVAAQQILPSPAIEFHVTFALPDGYKRNPLLPVKCRLAVEGEQSLIAAEQWNRKIDVTTESDSTTFRIPVARQTGRATLLLTLTYGYCRDGQGGLCKVDTVTLKLPIELSATADAKSVALSVSPK